MLSRVSSMTRSQARRIGSHVIGHQLSSGHVATGAWSLPPSVRMTFGAIPRRSELQYVHGRVDVSVVNGSAGGTGPVPDPQRQLGLHRAAPGAGFTGGREAVGDQQQTPVPLALVFKLPAQFAKRRVSHGGGEPRPGQPFDIQILDRDPTGRAEELPKGLLLGIGRVDAELVSALNHGVNGIALHRLTQYSHG